MSNLLQDLKHTIQSIETDIAGYAIYDSLIDHTFVNAKTEVLLELVDLVSRYEEVE